MAVGDRARSRWPPWRTSRSRPPADRLQLPPRRRAAEWTVIDWPMTRLAFETESTHRRPKGRGSRPTSLRTSCSRRPADSLIEAGLSGDDGGRGSGARGPHRRRPENLTSPRAGGPGCCSRDDRGESCDCRGLRARSDAGRSAIAIGWWRWTGCDPASQKRVELLPDRQRVPKRTELSGSGRAPRPGGSGRQGSRCTARPRAIRHAVRRRSRGPRPGAAAHPPPSASAVGAARPKSRGSAPSRPRVRATASWTWLG
jgi:hypothetical protein